MTAQNAPDFDTEVLQYIACPKTLGKLRYDPLKRELISDQAGLAYPIRNGIPILIAEEARSLHECF